jgi:hypothetical protein
MLASAMPLWYLRENEGHMTVLAGDLCSRAGAKLSLGQGRAAALP